MRKSNKSLRYYPKFLERGSSSSTTILFFNPTSTVLGMFFDLDKQQHHDLFVSNNVNIEPSLIPVEG